MLGQGVAQWEEPMNFFDSNLLAIVVSLVIIGTGLWIMVF
jgi:hypothetical protein